MVGIGRLVVVVVVVVVVVEVEAGVKKFGSVKGMTVVVEIVVIGSRFIIVVSSATLVRGNVTDVSSIIDVIVGTIVSLDLVSVVVSCIVVVDGVLVVIVVVGVVVVVAFIVGVVNVENILGIVIGITVVLFVGSDDGASDVVVVTFLT